MKLKDIPATTHFCALIEQRRSIHHDGDERSRTNPGHGYPAYTETIESLSYEFFDTKEELVAWLEARQFATYAYRIFQMIPLEVKTTTSVITAISSPAQGAT